MAPRKDAILTSYTGGGYLLSLPDGSEFEADTTREAISFAHGEGCTRVYSSGRFVLIGREDA